MLCVAEVAQLPTLNPLCLQRRVLLNLKLPGSFGDSNIDPPRWITTMVHRRSSIFSEKSLRIVARILFSLEREETKLFLGPSRGGPSLVPGSEPTGAGASLEGLQRGDADSNLAHSRLTLPCYLIHCGVYI